MGLLHVIFGLGIGIPLLVTAVLLNIHAVPPNLRRKNDSVNEY